MDLSIAPLLLRWRKAQGRTYTAVLRDELIQSRQHLEVPNDLGHHSLDLQQSELLSNAVSWTGTKRNVFKGSRFLQVKAIWSEFMRILEHTIVVSQHKKAQVQSGALRH